MSQLFISGGQKSIGVSALASVLPNSIQGWFPLSLTSLISLLSQRLSRIFSSTIVQKHQFFSASAFFMVQLSQPYVTTGKTIALTVQIFVSKVMSSIFNTLFRFVIAFLPKKQWSNLLTAVTIHSDFRAQEKEICHCFQLFPFCLPWSDGTRCRDLSFLILSFKPAVSLSSFMSSRGSLVPPCFLPHVWCHPHI